MNSQRARLWTIPPSTRPMSSSTSAATAGAGGLLQKSELPTQKQRETTVGI